MLDINHLSIQFIRLEDKYTRAVTTYVEAVETAKPGDFGKIQKLRSEIQDIDRERKEISLFISRMVVSSLSIDVNDSKLPEDTNDVKTNENNTVAHA